MKSKRLLAVFAAFTMSAALFAVGCKDNTPEGPDNNDVPQWDGTTDDENQNNPEDNKQNPGQDTSVKLTGKIYLVGDSTVCSFSDNYYLPRYGYGTQLYNYINCDANQIVNLALSGRSSLSFLTESNYTTLKNSIGEGDYLIIGFGHNDEKSDDAARFTNPNGDYTVSGSFQNVLYENYVKLANDKGATPILCTPVTRYDSSGAYSGSKVHVTGDGDYVKAIKDLGAAKDTTVIDLTALTVAEYKKDNAAAAYYHAHTTRLGDPGATTGTEAPDGRDDTHLNKFGAKMVAYKLTQALLLDTDCPLKNNVKTNAIPPAYENDYADAINMSYVKPDYKGFDPANTTATKLSDDDYGWYASYMGNTGGAGTDKIAGLSATYDNGKFTVGDTQNKQGTKFEGADDGFVAAFMQIPAGKNFTASVTVTVTQNGKGTDDKQSGFGMMLRDDILINTYDTTLASNYVAGGVLQNHANIFSRTSNTKINDDKTVSSSSLKAAVGDSHEITIKRLGQIITVTVDGQSHVYQEDKMDLFVRDNQNMYLCLFANRGFVVEFTNLVFTVTGDSQGA